MHILFENIEIVATLEIDARNQDNDLIVYLLEWKLVRERIGGKQLLNYKFGLLELALQPKNQSINCHLLLDFLVQVKIEVPINGLTIKLDLDSPGVVLQLVLFIVFKNILDQRPNHHTSFRGDLELVCLLRIFCRTFH
jgi:hypothetical protein